MITTKTWTRVSGLPRSWTRTNMKSGICPTRENRKNGTGLQGIGRGIESDVKGRLSLVDKVPDLGLVRDLRDQAALYQFFVNFHSRISFLYSEKQKIALAEARGRRCAVPPLFTVFSRKRPQTAREMPAPRNGRHRRSLPGVSPFGARLAKVFGGASVPSYTTRRLSLPNGPAYLFRSSSLWR